MSYTAVVRYRIEAEIGRGGMGRVYRALDTSLERYVALKVLGANADAEARARLCREARAAAAFTHPNAVATYDVGDIDGQPFIAMELVKGRTLEDAAKDASWAQNLSWLLDVARALEAAHATGLVHRDIKPENVMIADDGRVKVLDFGIARRPKLEAITARGLLVGTPHYMAPEYIKDQSLDPRIDQFAWGVMAYELFAGRTPWVGADSITLMTAILLEAPAPLVVDDLPAAVSHVVMRCLEKDPAKRHASMSEIIALLDMRPRAVSADASVEVAFTSPKHLELVLDTTTTSTPAPVLSMVPAAPRAPRSRFGAVAAVGLCLASAAIFAGTHRPEAPLAPASAVPAVVAAPPTPARAAFTSGKQAMRDASLEAAGRRFEQAALLEPGFSAAHLRAAVLLLRNEPMKGRAHYQSAVQLRGALDAHDQLMLDALEPVMRDPSDFAESERRLVQTLGSQPNDFELAWLLSWTRFFLGDFSGAREAIARAERIDPASALPALHRAGIEMFGGTREAAHRALEDCLERAPGATFCLKRRVRLEEIEGRCADAERDARTWLTTDPESTEARRNLAQTMVAQGKSLDVAEEIMRQGWSKLPADERRHVELEDRDALAEAGGDFTGAEKALRELVKLDEAEPELVVHASTTFSLTSLYAETGDVTNANAVANDFLRRKDGWTAPPGLDNFAIEVDLTPGLLAVQRRSGTLSNKDFDTRLSAWSTAWSARLPRVYRGFLWLTGYAATVETKAQAEAALAVLPSYEPLPPVLPGMAGDSIVGHVYALAGRPEGLPILERAAKSCSTFDAPLDPIRTHLWLADARAQAGDRAGACVEYKQVIRRGGKASRSARVAKARIQSLRCVD